MLDKDVTDIFNLVTVNIDGTNRRELGIKGISPTWSPDGKNIAFVGFNRDYEDDLVVLNLEDFELRRLTSGMDLNGTMCWSPDGTKIAFDTWDVQEEMQGIYVINVDGSNLTQLISLKRSTTGKIIDNRLIAWVSEEVK